MHIGKIDIILIFFYIMYFVILVYKIYLDFLVKFMDLFHKSVNIIELYASVL